jgi:hypothetical protein
VGNLNKNTARDLFVHPRVKQLDREGYALGRDECPHER